LHPQCFSIRPEASQQAARLFARRYAILSPHLPYSFLFVEVIFNLLESAFPGRKDLRVLDIGGGTGWFAARFLRTYPRGTAVLVDGLPCFCEEARKRLAGFGKRALVLNDSVENVDHWPLDADFDVITMNNLLHFVSPKFLSPLFQACADSIGRPGLLFATGNMGSPGELTSLYETAYGKFYDESRMTQKQRDAVSRIDRKIEQLRAEGETADALAATCVDHSLQGIMQRMKKAGFVSVDCCWKTCNAATVVATM